MKVEWSVLLHSIFLGYIRVTYYVFQALIACDIVFYSSVYISARVRACVRACVCVCVRVPGHTSRGPGSIPGATRFSEK
jgi:hypothetical protein